MKLLKSDKEAFVNSVMADVPKIEYKEQARKLVMDAAIAKLPPKVRAIWNDAELRGFIKCDQYYSTPFGLPTFYIPPVEFDTTVKARLDDELKAIGVLAKAQSVKRAELMSKVESVIYACSTLKQAQERLPEFVKYLPKERDKTGAVNLPAVANVVADLTKAGWPKKSKK